MKIVKSGNYCRKLQHLVNRMIIRHVKIDQMNDSSSVKIIDDKSKTKKSLQYVSYIIVQYTIYHHRSSIYRYILSKSQ